MSSPVLNLVTDFDEIKDLARDYANRCLVLPLDQAVAFTLSRDMALPQAQHNDGLAWRLASPKWWSRRLITKAKRHNESLLIHAGKVQKVSSAYCSEHAANDMAYKDSMSEKWLKEMMIESEMGDKISLYEAWRTSVSNPWNRFSEMIVRLKGLEAYALSRGDKAVFVTITAPGAYHSHFSNGYKNPNYNGCDPRETHQHLMAIWQKVRAQFAKHHLVIYGMRIVEPHHDGTPHYHLIVFAKSYSIDRAVSLMRKYFIEEDRDELVNTSVRFQAEMIDANKGSAVGYIIKYVSKNIDNAATNREVGLDYDADRPVEATVSKVVAWARTWGIRQFSFFGASAVTVWRELRRVSADFSFNSTVLDDLKTAAHNSDYAEFERLMKRCDVRLFWEVQENLNLYYEEIKKVKGISFEGKHHVSRMMQWKQVRSANDDLSGADASGC